MLARLLAESLAAVEEAVRAPLDPLRRREVGRLVSVEHGVALVDGLPEVQAEEVLDLGAGRQALALDLLPEGIGAVLLDEGCPAGTEVRRTGRILDVPVGERLLGRVVDPLGRPLDEGEPVAAEARLPAERRTPRLLERAPVREPLHTGVKVVDALLPLGRGQRELILGDRGTGKTALALDAVLNQADTGVLSVWCAVGQSRTAVGHVVEELRRAGALARTVVVVAGGDTPPGLQFLAPFAATSMAEWFRDGGRDVLIVYDDLTRHARAWRELSLLLRRPPGREAYPGDVFYLHSRLLERSTHLVGGGSLTALPILETEAGNVADYLPTNLISINDGQIVLSAELFQRGLLPAVDLGLSVSRVGGDAQLPAWRAVAGPLRMAWARYAELEVFTRFTSRLEESTRAALHRGRRIREVLKQDRGRPVPVARALAALLLATEGLFDGLPEEAVAAAEAALVLPDDLCRRIEEGETLTPEDLEALRRCAPTPS